jgi:hypothetical protein
LNRPEIVSRKYIRIAYYANLIAWYANFFANKKRKPWLLTRAFSVIRTLQLFTVKIL